MQDLRNKVALVTGAGSGIGEALAIRLAAQGVRLALTGRSVSKLERVAQEISGTGGKVNIFPADLTVSQDVNSLKAAVDDEIGRIDILIHCAGVYDSGAVEEASAESFLDMLKINAVAPYMLTQLFLPALRRRRGQVVFINTRAIFRSYPNLTQYMASKCALKAIADGLRMEVVDDGMRILSVYPGKTATPMQQLIQQRAGKEYQPEMLAQAADVAEMVIAALRLPEHVAVNDITIGPQTEP